VNPSVVAASRRSVRLGSADRGERVHEAGDGPIPCEVIQGCARIELDHNAESHTVGNPFDLPVVQTDPSASTSGADGYNRGVAGTAVTDGMAVGAPCALSPSRRPPHPTSMTASPSAGSHFRAEKLLNMSGSLS
jgi:hypothetical protein